MARSRKTKDKPASSKRPIEQYDHKGQQRKNNPHVGLVTPDSDRDAPKRVAVKSVDDRGIESLKIIPVP
jgi:adenine-specific DNA-methyltransferase